ncbi:MAG TPA: DNA-directed RNA polymerase subunit alpha C-terminal domain-containing protein, partial [Candidatus Paceibacterota bacterium]
RNSRPPQEIRGLLKQFFARFLGELLVGSGGSPLLFGTHERSIWCLRMCAEVEGSMNKKIRDAEIGHLARKWLLALYGEEATLADMADGLERLFVRGRFEAEHPLAIGRKTEAKMLDFIERELGLRLGFVPIGMDVAPSRAVLARKVEQLELSTKAWNCISQEWGENLTVLDLVRRTEADLLRVPNFRRTQLNEVKKVLGHLGLHLGMQA